MKAWFLRGLRRGVVTTHYPDRPEPSAERLPTPPVFRTRLLTLGLVDELCRTCPSGALRRDGDVLRYDVGACTCCGRCYPVAGDAAHPSGEVELAATARAQLVKALPIGAPR